MKTNKTPTHHNINKNSIGNTMVMKQLLHFEFKKIMDKKVNRISMLIGILLIIFCNIKLIQDETLHIGKEVYTGVEAIHKQEEIENALTSHLDENFLTQFLREYQKQTAQNPDGYDYAQISTKVNLFACIAKNYTEANEYFEWKNLMKINTDNGIGFYNRRIEKIQTLLETNHIYGSYTETEKDYWLQKAQSVEIPFLWGSKNTWDMIWNGIGITFYLFFVLSICIAPVFSGESLNHTDAFLLSTKYGTTKAVYAKIIASTLFSILYITLCTSISIGIHIVLLGSKGWNLPIQLWDTIIPYQWTVLEACEVNLLLILIMALMLTSMTLLLSSISKNPMIVLSIDILFFFGTIFLPISKNSALWNKLLNLLPLNAVDLKNVLISYNSYQFGYTVISYLGMIFTVYSLLAILFLISTKKAFQKHKIS